VRENAVLRDRKARVCVLGAQFSQAIIERIRELEWVIQSGGKKPESIMLHGKYTTGRGLPAVGAPAVVGVAMEFLYFIESVRRPQTDASIGVSGDPQIRESEGRPTTELESVTERAALKILRDYFSSPDKWIQSEIDCPLESTGTDPMTPPPKMKRGG
jgi:hypothetical protein